MSAHWFISWWNSVHHIRLWSHWERCGFWIQFSLYCLLRIFVIYYYYFFFPEDAVSPHLLDAKVLLISQKRCMSRNVYGNRMDDSMMCAGYMQGKTDSCQVCSSLKLKIKIKGSIKGRVHRKTGWTVLLIYIKHKVLWKMIVSTQWHSMYQLFFFHLL